VLVVCSIDKFPTELVLKSSAVPNAITEMAVRVGVSMPSRANILTLAALLILGSAILLTGSALTGLIMGFMRSPLRRRRASDVVAREAPEVPLGGPSASPRMGL
jgi:hypothetical protein